MDDYIQNEYLLKILEQTEDKKAKIREMQKRIEIMEQNAKLDPNRVDIGAMQVFILTIIQYCQNVDKSHHCRD